MNAEEELTALKQRWVTSAAFEDEQAYLEARVRLKDVRFVYLDPDGTFRDWIGIVVRHQTGVVYGTQCAGVATKQRFIEGYLVLVGGLKYQVDEGDIEVGPFVDVFHEDGACQWGWNGRDLPVERHALLSRLVESIPYWEVSLDKSDHKDSIRFDPTRAEEMAEGWIPVQTPDGPGILLYQNCD